MQIKTVLKYCAHSVSHKIFTCKGKNDSSNGIKYIYYDSCILEKMGVVGGCVCMWRVSVSVGGCEGVVVCIICFIVIVNNYLHKLLNNYLFL